MKKILFNNIGNRHLFYKNKNTTNNYLYNEKKAFRERTKKILENWEEEKDQVYLNILDQYLDQEEMKPDEIILFGTDQGETSSYNAQDTLFAAEIIKKILQEKYVIDQVQVFSVKANPSDENELFPIYKNKFNQLNNECHDSLWIFLDAGGTPQQKLVSKLLMPEIHYGTEIKYLKNVEGALKNELINKKTDELEKFFLLKNVKTLINKAHYSSAYDLLSSKAPKNKANIFIKIGKNRINNIYNNKLSINVDQLPRPQKEIILQYLNHKPLLDFEELESNLEDYDYFIFGEFLARALLFLNKKDYNNFIINFQQSLETLLIALLLYFAHEDGYNLSGRSDKEKLYNLLSNKYCKQNNTLPVQLDLAIELSDKRGLSDLKNLLIMYADILSGYRVHILGKNNIKGLDTLRNNLVHKGQSIVKNKALRLIIDAFNGIIKDVNLIKDSYTELNKIIIKRLFI